MEKKKAAVFGMIGGMGAVVFGIVSIGYFPTLVSSLSVIGGLIVIALCFQAFPDLRGFSFTVFILAAVAASLFHPKPFMGYGDYKFDSLIVPLLQVIMFGVGSTMGLRDFEGVVRTPKPVVIGIFLQFTIMPIVGYGIATFFEFPAEIAAGIILVGSVPSGLASNVMSYIADANVALSVTLTAIATLLAPLITPFLMEILAGQFVEINFTKMMNDILEIVIYPIAAGLVFNQLLGRRFTWLNRVMPLVSMVAIGAIITVITAAGRDKLLDVGLLLIGACLIHNILGYAIGFQVCRLLRMDEKSCRTIALEVGLQNAGLASGLAKEMGRLVTVGLAPAVFGPVMNVTGSMLASWWGRHPVRNKS